MVLRWLLFVFLIPFIATGQEWEVVVEKNGIIVEKNKETIRDVYHFRTTTKINASVNELEKLLENISNYPSWLYKYDKAELLNASVNTFLFRAKILAPFPLKDRKIKIKLIKSSVEDKIVYQMQSTPVTDTLFCVNCEEIAGMSGSWQLKKVSEKVTEIQNVTRVIADIPLPKAILYPLFYRAPQKSFENLLEMYSN